MLDNLDSISRSRYNWLIGYTKMIENRHPGITWEFESEDYTWRIFSRQQTLLIQVGFDLENKDIVYKYLADFDGEYGRTKELNDLKEIIPRLEEIDAFNR